MKYPLLKTVFLPTTLYFILLFGLAFLAVTYDAEAKRSRDSHGGVIETLKRTVVVTALTSLEFDIEDYAVVGIWMGADWTAADIQWTCAEKKGGTFYPVYDASGTRRTITASATRFLDLVATGDQLGGCRHAKLISSNAQAAPRTLVLQLGR